MKRTRILVFVMLATVSGLSQTSVKPRILSTVPSETKKDRLLEKAIRDNAAYDADRPSRYYYNRVDLNGDGRSEVIVFLFGGHQCGTGGCDALIFRKLKRFYSLVTHFEPSRNPIIVSTTRTRGWNDLIFFNSGGGINPGYYSIARFNGRTYPENPTVVADSPPLKKRAKGTGFVPGPYHPDAGLKLPIR